MANLDIIKDTIVSRKLVKPGDVIGVATSGGTDSMALLHKLKSLEDELDIEVVAIHVDHSIRENSSDDADFVVSYCKKNHIRVYKFKVDCLKIAKTKAISLESAAREARYGIFDAVLEKGIADKIAIAHHMQDQAETILLHLFRGAGLSGLKGMEVLRDEYYIRPMLDADKKEILNYIEDNDIPYVNDETNFESDFTRNYLRNEIFPAIQKKWPNIVSTLISFSKSATEDDEYINNQLDYGAVIVGDRIARIPLSYFLYHNSINSRIIFKALNSIGIYKDIEKKHIEIIRDLALNGSNGNKINLPSNLVAIREYDYLTLTNKTPEVHNLDHKFEIGEFDVKEYGNIIIKRAKEITKHDSPDNTSKDLFIDFKKLPKNATWRFRQDGDVFEKFGGGTKKLKSYLIDLKIPVRERDTLPVLAVGNEIFAIAGVEISNKLIIDDTTKSIYKISVSKKAQPKRKINF